jgi:hypothetical protein
MLPSSSTRAISEPKTEVAPPAGAVITVTVLAFMASRLGSFHGPSDSACLRAERPSELPFRTRS